MLLQQINWVDLLHVRRINVLQFPVGSSPISRYASNLNCFVIVLDRFLNIIYYFLNLSYLCNNSGDVIWLKWRRRGDEKMVK